MKVINHFKFRLFDYDSYKNDSKFQLGDVVIKINDNEIGVVIQTHKDGDFRTDMFGNASDSECRIATLEEINKFRKELLKDLVKSKTK